MVGPGASEVAAGPSGWTKTIGIVGGLGPHAHVRFEELLLRAVERRTAGATLRDQDYPPYLVSSLPGTPDRTDAVLGRGPSPLPWLERSLRSLTGDGTAGRLEADFAVIACNAAHAFVPELRARSTLPILSLVEEAVGAIEGRKAVGTVGILATTGTLKAGVYQAALAKHNLVALTLPDLPGGAELQRALVMESIYGGQEGPGIKAGAHRHGPERVRLRKSLGRAAGSLGDAGAEVVLTACTEIPLVLPSGRMDGLELVDPLEIAAIQALAVAAGAREVELDEHDRPGGKRP
ncbi:MAG: aspartate/glutamate racemase family protein [Thermoanaerobaculia bacterium]